MKIYALIKKKKKKLLNLDKFELQNWKANKQFVLFAYESVFISKNDIMYEGKWQLGKEKFI